MQDFQPEARRAVGAHTEMCQCGHPRERHLWRRDTRANSGSCDVNIEKLNGGVVGCECRAFVAKPAPHPTGHQSERRGTTHMSEPEHAPMIEDVFSSTDPLPPNVAKLIRGEVEALNNVLTYSALLAHLPEVLERVARVALATDTSQAPRLYTVPELLELHSMHAQDETLGEPGRSIATSTVRFLQELYKLDTSLARRRR
jgi:hypothetical protein